MRFIEVLDIPLKICDLASDIKYQMFVTFSIRFPHSLVNRKKTM